MESDQFVGNDSKGKEKAERNSRIAATCFKPARPTNKAKTKRPTKKKLSLQLQGEQSENKLYFLPHISPVDSNS